MHNPQAQRRWWWLAAVVMFAAVFAAHCRAINYGFSNFDDMGFLLEVDGYRGVTPEHIAWDFSHFQLGHYQPLTYLSYGIDYALWGLSPRAMHTTNILIHALNAVIVLWLTGLILKAVCGTSVPWSSVLLASTAGGLFFGVHPLRVESVAWITERRDVLSGCFLLLAACFYFKAHAPGEAAVVRPRFYWWSIALLLLSLLSKAWGMTFFAVLLVIDVYPLRRLSPWPWRWKAGDRAIVAQKVPFMLLGVVFAVIASRAQAATPDTVKTLAEWGVVERVVQSCYGLVFYPWKTLLPVGLAAVYELPRSLSPWEPRFLAAYVLLGAAAVMLVLIRRRLPGLVAAAVCYGILVSPVLGLLQSGIQLVADRYSYLACVPWALAVGWLCWRGAAGPMPTGGVGATEQRRIRLAVALIVLFAAGLGAMAWRQTGYWRTTEVTFMRAIDSGWDGPRVRRMLGKQIEQRGDRAGALQQYQRSVALDPVNGESWLAIGNVQRASGDLPASAEAYRRAVQTLPNSWEANVGLGLIAMRQDRLAEAGAAFRAAVEQAERRDHPAQPPGGGGLPHLLLAGVLDMGGDERASRVMLARAAEYPQVRKEALGHLAEMDAERHRR